MKSTSTTNSGGEFLNINVFEGASDEPKTWAPVPRRTWTSEFVRAKSGEIMFGDARFLAAPPVAELFNVFQMKAAA